jgi:putative thioredoxin
LAAAGQFEEALDTALTLIQSDRKRWGEPARKFMVDVFNLLPPDSELLSTYRRRLSTSLY